MLSLHLNLMPQDYSVASGKHGEAREFLTLHGSYVRGSDIFEGPSGEDIGQFYVRIARGNTPNEAGIIRGDGVYSSTFPVSLETALPPAAFDRVADGIARRATILGFFRDDFFDETERPFKRQEGYPNRLIWDKSQTFAFRLDEVQIIIHEPAPAQIQHIEPPQSPEKITPAIDDLKGQLVAIRQRLSIAAVFLLGLLIYAAR